MLSKAPLRFIRVRHLELRSYCPAKKKTLKEKIAGSNHFCPSCFLPLVVAFIFIFTVSQLIVIHRTIEAYKLRNQAYENCYFPLTNNNDSRTLRDLAFSHNFLPAWPTPTPKDLRNSQEQSYPYNLHQKRYLEHNWSPTCPETPDLRGGNLSINLGKDLTLKTIASHNARVLAGGKWKPDCNARFRVAIIIPFRDRWKHLKTLLSLLHPMLRRQQLAYQIFVVEQHGNYTFNKGILMNTGFLQAMNATSFDCVVFHDVDLVPEDDRNMYTCASKKPRHLSVAIDALDYRLPYNSLVGGVFAIRVEDFVQVNGYSNLFWGWGGEDDDISSRLVASHLQISRPNPAIARYKMLGHGRRPVNKYLTFLIKTSRIRFPKDGLTTCKFRLVEETFEPLFTHLIVDVGRPLYVVQNKTLKLQEELPIPDKYL